MKVFFLLEYFTESEVRERVPGRGKEAKNKRIPEISKLLQWSHITLKQLPLDPTITTDICSDSSLSNASLPRDSFAMSLLEKSRLLLDSPGGWISSR